MQAQFGSGAGHIGPVPNPGAYACGETTSSPVLPPVAGQPPVARPLAGQHPTSAAAATTGAAGPSGDLRMKHLQQKLAQDMGVPATEVKQAQEVEQAKTVQRASQNARDMLMSPLVVALVAGMLVALLLYVTAPPFVRKNSENPLYASKVSGARLAAAAFIAGGLTAGVPYAILAWKKNRACRAAPTQAGNENCL